MKWLLKARDVMGSFYTKYSAYVEGLCRFSVALSVYLTIIFHAGYNSLVSNPLIMVGFALLTCFLPWKAIPIFGGVLLILEIASASVEISILVAVVMVMMILLYYVFRAEKSVFMDVAMMLCLWNMPSVLLPFALFMDPIDVVVILFGIIIYGFVAVIKKDATVLSGNGLTLSGKVNLLLNDILSSNRLLILILAVCVVMLAITIIRKTKMNNASKNAMIVGDVFFCIIYFFGAYFLNFTIDTWTFIISMILNVAISFFVISVFLGLDFKRIEEIQFEDDEYYYYVKAVPKVTIKKTEQKEEIITASKEEEESESFEIPIVDFDMDEEDSLDSDEETEEEENE